MSTTNTSGLPTFRPFFLQISNLSRHNSKLSELPADKINSQQLFNSHSQMSDPSINKIKLEASDVGQLAQAHVNKNRRYTQLQPGRLSAKVEQIHLPHVQLLDESLDTGSRIEAAPPDIFLPFAFVTSEYESFRFCGKKLQSPALVQATGGSWELSFDNQFNYVATVFNRQYFEQRFSYLSGFDFDQYSFDNQVHDTNRLDALNYLHTVRRTIKQLNSAGLEKPSPELQNLITSELMRATIASLSPIQDSTGPEAKIQKRRRGVKKVIDYLYNHAQQLPDMATLCKVAGISERSLQYGFKEHLNTTPIKYLRLLRLNGVHQELLSHSPKSCRVADIAIKWGFLEFGRFSREYRQLFYQLPSETLRS